MRQQKQVMLVKTKRKNEHLTNLLTFLNHHVACQTESYFQRAKTKAYKHYGFYMTYLPYFKVEN